MIKRVLLTIAVTVLVLGLCGGYFYHTGNYAEAGRNDMVCQKIDIAVQDSAVNRIITSAQIRELVGDGIIGQPVDSIRLNVIESRIDSLGEVLSSEVYTTTNTLVINVMPRTASIRFITNGGQNYYCDATGYIFPVESSVNTPLITGNIPLRTGKNFKGYTSDTAERIWLRKAIELTSYIEESSYWKRMVSHININEKGDFEIYPLTGNVRFILGDAEGISEKFRKMAIWYKAIAPLEKAAGYTTVDLKYDNQIICR